jgi:hypothetical protein
MPHNGQGGQELHGEATGQYFGTERDFWIPKVLINSRRMENIGEHVLSSATPAALHGASDSPGRNLLKLMH